MTDRYQNLIKDLVEQKVLVSPHLIAAFKRVDRTDFVLDEYKNEAHTDIPLPIGFAQTVSQPFTVAFMLELLQPETGENVLDIGSGSGWTTALLAEIIGPEGHVTGTEIIPELAAFGQENLATYDFPNAEIQEAGTTLGLPERAPYERILVSAAATHLPLELVAQLAIGGVLVIPIDNAIWKVVRTTKDETDIEKFEGFVFVRLIEQ